MLHVLIIVRTKIYADNVEYNNVMLCILVLIRGVVDGSCKIIDIYRCIVMNALTDNLVSHLCR